MLNTLRRVLRKPPRYVVRRVWAEARGHADQWFVTGRAERFDLQALLACGGDRSLSEMWVRLAGLPYLSPVESVDRSQYDRICPGDAERIFAAAELSMQRKVDLLGSGLTALGQPIDWLKDYKSGYGWPRRYWKQIDYINVGRPSDVKFPWELSRLQWAICIGQAYLLTGDDRYAACIRELLEDWIAANPYAWSVNWACAMEPALRILCWTWLFHACNAAPSWQDEGFQATFLRALHLHGEFTERNLEHSDINGNHYTTDAAGLVTAGLFFGKGEAAERWAALGWRILTDELPRQVHEDGVDFEAATAYHRLVLELFLLPALYRRRRGLEVPGWYSQRLVSMVKYTAAYSRPDGSTPLWGDADDGRALPFGGQPIHDHRYLVGAVGAAFAPELLAWCSGPRTELFWLLGTEAESIPNGELPAVVPGSTAFPQGGFYIMRNERDHVFIDCGPVGLAGRGGHGHNDILSFEAVLDGVHLVTDCGAYVYTSSFEERNQFRSTAFHNTPQINGAEANRFFGLFGLHNDAQPELREWLPGSDKDCFRGAHLGYQRLQPGLKPVRRMELSHDRHSLLVEDEFNHPGLSVSVPLHLAPGVVPQRLADDAIALRAAGRQFRLTWSPRESWAVKIEPSRVSPSYGVVVPAYRLSWSNTGPAKALSVRIVPDGRTEC